MGDWFEKYQNYVIAGLIIFIALGGLTLLYQEQHDKISSAQNSFSAEKQNWQREKDELGQQIQDLQTQVKKVEETKPAPGASSIIAGVSTSQASSNQAATGLVNINTADAAAFDNLPGIGPSKAAAIVQYRTDHGLFKKTTDLKNVKGIGDSTFEKLKDKITI